MQSFQDTALLFANSISLFLRQDEEFRNAWRYKHRQEALKAPRREALKNANAWAALVADHLEQQASRDTIENYTGKLWIAWEEFTKCRDNHIECKTDKTLTALKESENAIKQCCRAINALIQ